jgi:hypothetical protein
MAMAEKLIRNTTDKRWREFWEGVDRAAARAPVLYYSVEADLGLDWDSQTHAKPDREAGQETPPGSSKETER